MIGTVINVAAILVGGTLGLLFGARLPERIRETVIAGLGLFTAVVGLQLTFKSQQPLIVLGSLITGGILGEWWRIEDGLRGLGAWLEKRLAGGTPVGSTVHKPTLTPEPEALSLQPANQSSRFIRGFLTASLLFSIGPMAILGAMQDGLTGDFNLLVIKSVMDGFASLAFASSLGAGVLFSALVILVYQGSLTLLAGQAQTLVSPEMMNEMTATGGVLLVGIALSSLLEIKPIRVGNLLPALIVAPLIVALLTILRISY